MDNCTWKNTKNKMTKNVILKSCIIIFGRTMNSLSIPLKTILWLQIVELLYCHFCTWIQIRSLIMTLDSEMWNCGLKIKTFKSFWNTKVSVFPPTYFSREVLSDLPVTVTLHLLTQISHILIVSYATVNSSWM